MDAASVCNVFQRVRIKQDEISLGANLHHAEITGPPEEFCRIDSPGLQGFEWCETSIDQILKFMMYGKAGYVEYLR